jgi:DNA-binding response OmpR family regulator
MDRKPRLPKVLYVEDDAGLAALYVARFKQEGFVVMHCLEGDKALQAGKEFRPDLIIIDLMMPTLSGFDAIEMFRSLSETALATIIVMSALSQQQDVERAIHLGANDYLVKSQVLMDDVIATLWKHLAEAGFEKASGTGDAQAVI